MLQELFCKNFLLRTLAEIISLKSPMVLEGNLQFGNFISRKGVTGGNKLVPGQPLLVEKHPKRFHTGHQHVHPQVEFQPVDQERFLQVSLYAQRTLFHGHLLEVIDHFYPHPAKEVGWFDDPEAILGSPHRPPEEVAFARQDVSVRHVAPFLLAKLLTHPCIVLKQKSFFLLEEQTQRHITFSESFEYRCIFRN